MDIYVYDNSFSGLLCALYNGFFRPVGACKEEGPPSEYTLEYQKDYLQDALEWGVVSEGLFQGGLFDNYLKTESCDIKAKKMEDIIRTKIGKNALDNIYYLYLSEADGVHRLISEYLKLGFKYGSRTDGFRTNAVVDEVMHICRRVGLERHRFLGFVRFSCVRGSIYFSKICPDYNILPLIAPHFLERMSSQSFIIYDEKRKTAAVCKEGKFVITEVDDSDIIIPEDSDKVWEGLWRVFYDNIEIKPRMSEKRLLHFMPRRYWKNILEKNGSV